MLGEEEVRAVIVCRLAALAESGSSLRSDTIWASIGALVYVLIQEHIGPRHMHEDAKQLLSICRIPFVWVGNKIEIDEAWLRAHGFGEGVPGSGHWRHPRFS